MHRLLSKNLTTIAKLLKDNKPTVRKFNTIELPLGSLKTSYELSAKGLVIGIDCRFNNKDLTYLAFSVTPLDDLCISRILQTVPDNLKIELETTLTVIEGICETYINEQVERFLACPSARIIGKTNYSTTLEADSAISSTLGKGKLVINNPCKLSGVSNVFITLKDPLLIKYNVTDKKLVEKLTNLSTPWIEDDLAVLLKPYVN